MEDVQILQLLWERAESAIEALSAKFGKRLNTTAMNILDDSQDAEEAVNDTYLALWNAIPPARPDPLCAYVYRVGRNIALKHLRSRTAQKRNNRYDLCLDELSEILPGGTAEELLDARELGRCIDRFLDTLDDTNRSIFLRRYWFGDDLEPLAVQFHFSVNTLSVRLHRIREKLKNYLIKEGFWNEV